MKKTTSFEIITIAIAITLFFVFVSCETQKTSTDSCTVPADSTATPADTTHCNN